MNLRILGEEITFNMLVDILSENEGLDLEVARKKILEMTFSDYYKLIEDITPPSGQIIGPSSNQAQTNAPAPNGVKSIWPGKGAPVEVGMTVGLKGPNGMPVPGQISQVDTGAKGVKIKNPTTGQDEWANMDALQPFMATGNNSTAPSSVNQDPTAITTATEDATDLIRLRELAGIKENCSAGATGAGSIAIAPTALNGIKRRQPTDEEVKKEYVPKEAAKTIVGDTKPNQASGELSSNLTVRGKRTASRTNNGFKR